MHSWEQQLLEKAAVGPASILGRHGVFLTLGGAGGAELGGGGPRCMSMGIETGILPAYLYEASRELV